MDGIQLRFVGVELYFDNLEKAKDFYRQTLGLNISEEEGGHHAKFDGGVGFICLECKGPLCTPQQFDRADL